MFNLEKVFMAGALKYMVDENGEKTSVVIPIKTWKKLNQEYDKLQNKINVLTGVQDGLAEVKKPKKVGSHYKL